MDIFDLQIACAWNVEIGQAPSRRNEKAVCSLPTQLNILGNPGRSCTVCQSGPHSLNNTGIVTLHARRIKLRKISSKSCQEANFSKQTKLARGFHTRFKKSILLDTLFLPQYGMKDYHAGKTSNIKMELLYTDKLSVTIFPEIYCSLYDAYLYNQFTCNIKCILR